MRTRDRCPNRLHPRRGSFDGKRAARAAVYLAAALAAVFAAPGSIATPAQELLQLEGNTSPVHDPAAIKEKGT